MERPGPSSISLVSHRDSHKHVYRLFVSVEVSDVQQSPDDGHGWGHSVIQSIVCILYMHVHCT